jgi:hypothetical protein
VKRRLFTALCTLSLVLCLASVGMWVRSGFVMDYAAKVYEAGGTAGILELSSDMGGLFRLDESFTPPRYLMMSPHEFQWCAFSGKDLYRPWPRWEWRWPEYRNITFPFVNCEPGQPRGIVPGAFRTTQSLFLPYWLATMLTAVLPGLWWWRRSKINHRRKAGLCRTCGYDLRASPDRCPECGTPIIRPRDTGTKAG